MTDRELAYNLAMALEALGRLKGATFSLRDTVIRELGDSHVSDDMRRLVNDGLQDIELHVSKCFDAISGPVELEGIEKGEVDGE